MRDWCLVTDIDGTLVGDRGTTAELRSALVRAREERRALGGNVRLVVATGRDVQSAREVLEDAGFSPTDFDALITSVGAEIYLPGQDEPQLAYTRRLRDSGFQAQLVREALSDLELEMQPEHEQFPYKVCYFAADTARTRALVAERLSQLPFATEVMFAMDSYLDVAPACGAKGGAVEYLAWQWALSTQQLVAAGDSGNDSSMLGRAWPSIVVGNGHAALAGLRGRTGVYFARAKYAAGVLEGLRALKFL